MTKAKINATTLRLALFAGLFVIIAIGVGIFFYGHQQLAVVSKETSELATKAAASSAEQQNLERTKQDLQLEQNAIDRASKIVAISESYKYQDQIITEVGELARKVGVVIEGVTFESSEAGSTPAPAAAPAVAPAPVTDGSVSPGAPPVAAPSLKTTSATIALENPVEYDKIVSFVYLLEQNITKMRITSLNLSADRESGSKSNVNSGSITIEVYLR